MSAETTATTRPRAVRRHVFVRDPAGRSKIQGFGTVLFVEQARGRIVRVHVDLGLDRIAHVPLDWIDETRQCGNVVPLARPARSLAEWSATLFANNVPDDAA